MLPRVNHIACHAAGTLSVALALRYDDASEGDHDAFQKSADAAFAPGPSRRGGLCLIAITLGSASRAEEACPGGQTWSSPTARS